MSDPILVRGEITKGVTWSRALVPLGVVVGAALFWFAPPPGGLIIGIAFAFIWICLEIYVARQRSLQMWVRDTGDGLDLIDKTGERHIPDIRINSVSLKTEGVYSNGVQSGSRRIFTFWSDLEPDPVVLDSKFKNKQVDPLATVINRIITTFHNRTQEDLLKGEVLAGVGWRLDNEKLSWGKGEAKESIPRAEISACEEFDGHICVWRKGQDEALTKFKLGTRNCCLLPMLLHVASAEGESVHQEDQTGLGRILFERKPGSGAVVGLGCLGLAVLLIGVLCLVGWLVNPKEIAVFLVGLGLTAGGFGLGFWGYSMRFKAFRCHERGVVQLGLRSRKELRYEETGAFTYAAIRMYHNGAYMGTNISLKFVPLPESKSPKISYGTSIKNEDAAIEELRNFISRAIASRMAKRLQEGQEVAWTPNLTFTAEGIVYRPPGFIGRKDAKLLTYEDYGGWNMDQGVFYLFQKGEKKAVTNEQASAVNFYPGFFLLMLMQE